MAVDPVVSVLAKQSASRLKEMRDDAVKQREDLRIQIEWLDRALVEKGHSPAPSASANGTRPGRRRGNKREAIKAVLGTEHRVWTPNEIREGLAAQGIDMTVEAVRVALRRMSSDEVERGPDGVGWKLPSVNGSTQEPLTEVPSSGPEGVRPAAS